MHLKGAGEVQGIARGITDPLFPLVYFSRVDITKKHMLNELSRKYDPDVIFHLAAMCKRRYPDSSMQDYIKVNVYGTKNLIQSFPEAKVIYASTCGVKKLDNHPYFLTKKVGENLALNNKNVAVARLTNVYGTGKNGGVLSIFIDSAVKNKNLSLHTNQVRDFVGVEDVCRALEVLALKGELGEIYEVGSGQGTSIDWVAERVITLTKSKSKISSITVPKQIVVADVKKLENLGFNPKCSFESFVWRKCNEELYPRETDQPEAGKRATEWCDE